MTDSVTLLVLGSRKLVIEACVLDVSTSGIQVRSPTRLTCATRVEIEGNDGQMLGTVCHCEAHDGAYQIGVQLSDPLSSLLELDLLNRALIGPGTIEKTGPALVGVKQVKNTSSGKGQLC